MKLKEEGGSAFFISDSAEEARILFKISDDPDQSEAFSSATGIQAFGYIVQDSARNEPNRIRVELDQVEKVKAYMQSLHIRVE